MKVMIELPLDRYDAFLNKCRTSSPEYAILLGAVIARRPKGDHYEPVAEIVCEIAEARALLRIASRLHPDAAPAIEKAIKAAAG